MKKLTLSVLGLLLAQVASFAVVDLGAAASRTPYDSYMHPVKEVLGTLPGQTASLDKVNSLMREGRNFRYSFTTPYEAALPSVTAQTHAGDCKAKALWLAEELGDSNVRFVVGKMHANSQLSHAWLMWQHDGRWFILDCTNNSRPIAADSVRSTDYVPLFSWSKNGVYRHASGLQMVAIASGKRSPVASNTER
jgi:hypothetical protein